MNRGKMLDLGNEWEDLRKQARQLENEIDLKLASLSKLGTSFTGYRDFTSTSDTAPLLNKSSSEHMFDTMAMDIEELLAKLTVLNDMLSEYTQHMGVNAPLTLHTLQRHRDILLDYSHEFQKTKANIVSQREREDLLGSVRRDINNYKNSSQTDLYLKEHEHLVNSDKLVDEQISIAMATKENMSTQKGTLKNITYKINTLSNRFPLINNLIQKVNFRKRRDSIILGSIIAICIILLLLYAFH